MTGSISSATLLWDIKRGKVGEDDVDVVDEAAGIVTPPLLLLLLVLVVLSTIIVVG